MGDKLIYFGLIVLLLWTPIPLGSDRLWSSLLMAACIFFLAAAWLYLFAIGKTTISSSFKSAMPCCLSLGIGIGWNALQTLHLPLPWVIALSPHAVNIYATALEKAPSHVPISVDVGASLISIIKGTAYLTFFCLVLLVVNSQSRLKSMAYCVVVGGIFQAVYGGLTALGGSVGSVATGTFVNRNHLAGYLELCLALGVGLLLGEPSVVSSTRWRARLKSLMQLLLGPKARLRLGLAIMVIALVLTRSRMGNTAFFTSLLISGGIGLALFRTAKKSTLILLASLVVVDMLIVGNWFGVEEIAVRIQNTDLSTEDRDDVDVNAIPLLKDYWLTGSGVGSFYNIFTYYKPHHIAEYWDHAHNDFMEFASEFGLIGFIPLSFAVISSFYAAIKAQLSRKNFLQRGMGFASTMGLMSLLIHSSVDFNLQIPANALLFVLVMAIAWIALSMPEKPLPLKTEQ